MRFVDGIFLVLFILLQAQTAEKLKNTNHLLENMQNIVMVTFKSILNNTTKIAGHKFTQSGKPPVAKDDFMKRSKQSMPSSHPKDDRQEKAIESKRLLKWVTWHRVEEHMNVEIR